MISVGEVTRRVCQARKNRQACESGPGLGTAKAVVASGAVTVHVPRRLTPSQESAARA